MVGDECLPKAGSHAFSCGDSLPVWAWNLEDRNMSESAPWKWLDLPTKALKGQPSQGRACPMGSLEQIGVLMNGPRNLGLGFEPRESAAGSHSPFALRNSPASPA